MGAVDKKYTLRTRDVAGYIFLPRILPRIKEFATSGFGYLAFLIALVYQAVRILPANHPYCQPDNIGRFGIRHVLGESANRVEISTRNIDQVIIFFAILGGIIILLLQFASLLFMVFTETAWAAGNGAGTSGLFYTQHADKDIAFEMMDRVFGVPGFFNSGAAGEIPTPFHEGLHVMFELYNTALLIVGVLIFIYYIIVVTAETAQTGTPFGTRFKHIYAPIRLVVALGLLIPLAYGLNASQYITLWAAKYGSSFATNGWKIYNKGLENPIGIPSAALIAKPTPPAIDGLVEFMSLVQTCRASYKFLKSTDADDDTSQDPGVKIKPYLIKGNESLELLDDMDYETALKFYETSEGAIGGDIIIRYGEKNENKHTSETGFVRSYCGELTVPVRVRNPGNVKASNQAGPEWIQNAYFEISHMLWFHDELVTFGERMTYRETRTGEGAENSFCYASDEIGDGAISSSGSFNPADDPGFYGNENAKICEEATGLPPFAFAQEIINFIKGNFAAHVEISYEEMKDTVKLGLEDEVVELGWGGAGIYFNAIAEINGGYFKAVNAIPSAKSYPDVMEYVLSQHRIQDGQVDNKTLYSPNLANGKPVEFKEPEDAIIAKILNDTYLYWKSDGRGDVELTGNIFYDAINALFGTYGLFDMRANQAIEGPNGGTYKVHPLAQLVGIGAGLLGSAVRNLAYSMGFAAGGGAIGIISGHLTSSLTAISTFYVSIATIGLTGGFVLFYVVPFLPFIYFFFAVGSWVKTVFEAMVGAPLWALAHLRIDDDGLPGKSALNGYFLILEIFIRPILTIFGLIGGMAIFTALAHILNEIFDIIIQNLTGFDELGYIGYEAARENNFQNGYASSETLYAGDFEGLDRYIIDEFFFTVVYTILIYMMAVSSFKMIDLVPKSILRWMGSSAASFGDQTQDPTQDLMQYAGLGAATFGGQLAQGLSQASQGAGSTAAGVADLANKFKKNKG